MPADTTRTIPMPLRLLITLSTSQRNLNGVVTFRPTLSLVASALISAPTSLLATGRRPHFTLRSEGGGTLETAELVAILGDRHHNPHFELRRKS